MGTRPRERDAPRWASGTIAAHGLAVVLASGCGTAVSLDAASASAEASTTGAAAATGDATASGTEAQRPDFPLPDVPAPPPAACPAPCAVALPLVWAWDEDPPHGVLERRLVAMARAPDGMLVLAEVRDGESWLTGVDRDGARQWSKRLSFGCVCELVDLAFDAGGSLVVIAEGLWPVVRPVMVYAYALEPEGPAERWNLLDFVRGTPTRNGRTGTVVPLGSDALALPVVEVGLGAHEPDREWVSLRYYHTEIHTEFSVAFIDTQLAIDPRWRPRAAAPPGGRVGVTLPGPATTGDYVAWVESEAVSSVQSAPGAIDAMAAGPDGRLVVAGSRRRSHAQLELQIAGLDPTGPLPWQHAAEVPSTTFGAPVLAMDAHGTATVALRTTAGPPDDPHETAVALWRITADGAPLWSTSVPLPVGRAPEPLALVLADDDHDLVLAALVDGRLHLERRTQGCSCD
jgi:uncharacterized protein YceK